MTISLPASAIAAPQGIAPAGDPATSPLATVAGNISAGVEVARKLKEAMEGLDPPTAAGILRTQILTAQLSVMTAATSSAVNSLTDTAKKLIHNGL
ncbi:hypothetical protein BH11PSE7_BH11PSE7_31840 [soil metagenome]